MPYDIQAMRRLVRATEKNIETFKGAIREEKRKLHEYETIIADLEQRQKTIDLAAKLTEPKE